VRVERLPADSRRWIPRRSERSLPRVGVPPTRKEQRTNSQAKRPESRDERVVKHPAAVAGRAERTKAIPDRPNRTEANGARSSPCLFVFSLARPRSCIFVFLDGKPASYSSPALNDGPAATIDSRRKPKNIGHFARCGIASGEPADRRGDRRCPPKKK
jgi:hypothetical protein